MQALPRDTAHRKLALRLPRTEEALGTIVGEKGLDSLLKEVFHRSLGKQASNDVVDNIFAY